MKANIGIAVSFVFLIWFTASIIGMVYVSRRPELVWLVPVFIGQYFAVFGLIGAVSMYAAKRKKLIWLGLLFILIGAALIALPLVYHYGSKQTQYFINDHMLSIIGTGILAAGLFIDLANFISYSLSDSANTTPVQGVCVELQKGTSNNGKPLYSPVYEVWLNGESVRLNKKVYSNVGLPEVGETRLLYIREDDPQDYSEPIADKFLKLIMYCISLPFIAAGGIMLIVNFFISRH